MRALAIDVGSTSVRTAVVDEAGAVSATHRRRLSVASPAPGLVELDPTEVAAAALELAHRTLADAGGADVVGVTNQRATTVVYDAATGAAVGPALSWQDLRTVLDCLTLQGEGLRLAPNQSATKAAWLVRESGRDPRALGFATIETWVARALGAEPVSDLSNAAVTGLLDPATRAWSEPVLAALGLAGLSMPRVSDTAGDLGVATALPGAPRIGALVGDQSASLFGQSRVTRGAKLTLGTGAMLDAVTGPAPPAAYGRTPTGCFPVVASSRAGAVTWGVEAIMLSAGDCLAWLRDGFGLITDAAEADALAASVPDAHGVAFVPALAGLGTPYWDFGARGGFTGLTRGATRAHLARAVLEGVAQRGADLVEAVRAETGDDLAELRVDGGMTASRVLLQSLADASGAAVAVSGEVEATARGAGLMALVGAGAIDPERVEALWSPAATVVPRAHDDERAESRARWAEAVGRVTRTIPELSAVEF